MTFVWSEDATEQLTELVGDGFSATRIAEIMGGGLSRGAILGKLFRLGLHALSRHRGPSMRATRPKPQITIPADAPPRQNKLHTALEQPEPMGTPSTMLGPGLCKFIHGDVAGEWRMCGHKTGSAIAPWCPACRQIVFDKTRTAAANKSAQARAADAKQTRTMMRMGLG